MKRLYGTLTDYEGYVHPGMIIGQGLLWGMLSFFVILIVLLIFRKKIMVARQHFLLRLLAYSYFLVLPLLAGFFGFKWGLLNGARKDIRNDAEMRIGSTTTVFDHETQASVDSFFAGHTSAMAGMSTDQVIDAAVEVLYGQYVTALQSKSGQDNAWYWLMQKTSNIKASGWIKHKLHEILKEKIGVSEHVSQTLMATKVTELLRGNLFARIAFLQADYFLAGMQRAALILYACLLAVPLLEIIIAHALLRRKARALATQIVSPATMA